MQPALCRIIAPLGKNDCAFHRIPGTLQQSGEDHLGNIRCFENEPRSRLERPCDRFDKRGIPVVVEITEAVAQAASAGKRAVPRQVAHLALFPNNLARSARCLSTRCFEKISREIDTGHFVAAAGKLERVTSATARHIQKPCRRAHAQRLQDEVGLAARLVSRGQLEPPVYETRPKKTSATNRLCCSSLLVPFCLRLSGSCDAESFGVRCEGFNHESDVLVEVRAERSTPW